jgi:hypothetical protein
MSNPRRKIVIGLAIACSVAAGLVGCSTPPTALFCTADLRASLRVDVLGAATGAPAAAGSVVLLRSATIRDSVAPPAGPPTLLTAYLWFEDATPAGLYSVTVLKPGYQPWRQSDINIASDGCHVKTLTRITAMLRAS